MGRIFEKRKEKMFARWAKNAKAFTKIGKEIAIAIKLGGPDPDGNPRLRMAIQSSKALNMPKDRVDAAIKRATAKDQVDLNEVTYEGYAPHGVAVVVETATDNPTRTVANVRSIFSRYGGSMGTTGSLDYLFQKVGAFKTAKPSGDLDEFELSLIDHGLEELEEGEDFLVLYSKLENFGQLQRALEISKIEVQSAASQRIPNTLTNVSSEQSKEIQELIDALEEDDDVQHVYHSMQNEEEAE
jgi:YebC/PmpR family DNA-binding regulatory protein